MREIDERVFVIKPGEIIYDNDEVRYASSSVVLIKDDSLILVDTGQREDWEKIQEGLEEANVSPEDIEILVNTHLHVDHVGCNEKFKHAKKYAHPEQIELAEAEEFEPAPENISKRTSVLQTPGHTKGHISIVFDDRIILAGDAVPTREHYEERKIPSIHTDPEITRKSLNKVCEMAEIIIPGHDSPVKVCGGE